jgi:hypothetical protein
VGAFTVGGCKKALSEAVRYANTRIQFSQPISSFGLIKEKLAGMFVDIYTNESLVYRVAGMIDDKLKLLTGPETEDGNKIASAIHEYAAECSICKVYGSEALNRCADEWIQILGGYGFCSEYGAERLYRDCRINRIFEGTNEINRLLIAGTLIKRAMTGKLPMQYQQGIADSGDMSLHSEINTIQEIKKLFLLVAGTCAARYQLELTAEQEVTALLSNMVIEIFTCESNLLRAEKASQSGSESSQYMKSASLIYLKESLTRIRCYIETIVARLGQDAESMGDQFNRAYDSVRTIDVIKEKRYVAEKVIGTERYFLD